MAQSDLAVEAISGLGPTATIINAGKHAGRREIAGAVRYRPDDLLGAEHLALPLAHDRPVVLYDESGHAGHLDAIATKLRENGYADVRVLRASLADYEEAGGATQEPSLEQIVPPARPGESP
jgi:rhodanese-related sulfurtransferase